MRVFPSSNFCYYKKNNTSKHTPDADQTHKNYGDYYDKHYWYNANSHSNIILNKAFMNR